MAAAGKPWEKYQTAPAPAAKGKPWERYGAAPEATSAAPAPVAEPKTGFVEDLKKVPQTFTAGVLQGLGSMGATLLAPYDYLVPEEYGGRPNRRAEITNALSEMYQPSSTGVSGFAGGVGHAIPIVAGTAGLSAPAAAAEKGLVGAIASGGLNRTVAGIGTRMIGGGISGATAAGYENPENMGGGALIGMGLPVVGAAAGQTIRKLLEAYNALGPGAAKARVGEMLRNALGSRAGATEAAQAAQPNQLASLASAEASTPAYQALLRVGEQMDTEGTRYFADQAAKKAERAALGRAAGGATQTEARAVRQRSKDVLDEITAPMRERSLELADIGGTRGKALEGEAARASAAASAAVQDVRRFSAAADRASEWARTWGPSSGAKFGGQPRPPVQATYPGELAQRAEQVATTRAGESLTAGETRREAETRLASLKAAGLKPLTIDRVQAGIRQRLADPNVRANTDTSRVLTTISDMLSSFADANGVIPAEALYAVRKNGISNVIEQISRDMEPTTKKRFTAEVSSSIKPLIDDAIEAAGGKGWRDYLKTFEAGMSDISRKELLAKAMELYDTNPDQFRRLVEAESPDVVEGILGPGKYDILKELTGKLGPLDEIVSSIRTRTMAGGKATEGAQAANRLIAESERSVRIPNFLSPKVTLTNEVLKGLEGKISSDALTILSQASRSGKAANEAMAALMPADRNKFIQFMRQYVTRNQNVRNALAATRPGAVAATTNALSEP